MKSNPPSKIYELCFDSIQSVILSRKSFKSAKREYGALTLSALQLKEVRAARSGSDARAPRRARLTLDLELV